MSIQLFACNLLTRSYTADHPVANLTLAEFFTRYGFSTFFYENYIVPMVASIWSTPADKAFESFPLLTLVRFMRNHRLLQIGKRPTWLTVNNGSKTYLNNVLASNPILPRLGYRVTALERGEKHVKIKSSVHGKHVTETFDWVILACHADTSLNILGMPSFPSSCYQIPHRIPNPNRPSSNPFRTRNPEPHRFHLKYCGPAP